MNQLSALFDHTSDEVRIASSLCLGLVSISNLNDSVNYLIREVSTNSHHRYYFVVAINELILNRTVTHQLDTLAPFIIPLCDLFFYIVDSLPTDAAKPLMADCIGKLSIIHHESGLKYLVGKTVVKSPKICSLAASAFKYSLQHIGDAQHDKIIMETFPSIVNLLNFDDNEVQKSCLVTIGMALRNHAHLLSPGVSDLLPLVANQTIFRVI